MCGAPVGETGQIGLEIEPVKDHVPVLGRLEKLGSKSEEVVLWIVT